MAFQISKDQRFYLEMALTDALEHADAHTYAGKVYASMEKRGWIARSDNMGHWIITPLGRTVARQLGIAPVKDGQL